MDAFRRQAAHPLKVELLDEVELLQQHVAAGVRRHFPDAVPVVVDVDRLLPARLERPQVRSRDQAAVLAAEGGDLLRQGPFVESGAALPGDAAQGGPEVFLDEKLSGFQRPSPGLEESPRDRVGGKQFVLFGEHGGELLADREPALAQVDRGGENLGETEPSEALVRLEPAVDQAGNRNAEDPLHRDAAALEVELPGCAGGCRTGGVEAVHLPRGGVVDQDEPVSSHPGHRQLDHPESGGGGDRRIYGAAPCLHRADAGLGGERIPRGDGAVAAAHRGAVRRMGCAVRRGHCPAGLSRRRRAAAA